MRTRKYFNEKLYRDYLPDKTIITFKSDPISCGLNFNPKRGVGIVIPVSNGRFFLKNIGEKYMITGSIRVSGCRLARLQLKNKYPDFSALDEERSNDNYLPTILRAMLKREKIPISIVRKIAVDEIWNTVEVALNELMQFSVSMLIKPLCWDVDFNRYLPFSKKNLQVHLKDQEVAFDIWGPRSLSIPTQERVIEGFNSYAEKCVDGYYETNGFRSYKSSIEREQNAFQYPAIKMHISKVDENKAGPFIIYKKAIGDGGSITRFEGTSDDKSIQLICGSNRLESRKDYAEALSKIAAVHFAHFRGALKKVTVKSPSLKNKLKNAILTIFKSRGNTMLHKLKKNGYRISTSGKSMSSSKAKIAVLAKNNVIFEKIKGPIFKVNFELTSNWEERYAALKAKEKEERSKKKKNIVSNLK